MPVYIHARPYLHTYTRFPFTPEPELSSPLELIMQTHTAHLHLFCHWPSLLLFSQLRETVVSLFRTEETLSIKVASETDFPCPERTISFCQETRLIDAWATALLLLSVEDAVVPCLKNTACGGIYLYPLPSSVSAKSDPSIKGSGTKMETIPSSPGLGLEHQMALESEGNWGKGRCLILHSMF